MVVNRIFSIIIALFFFISCKDSKKKESNTYDVKNKDSLLIYEKRKKDSLLQINRSKEQYPLTRKKIKSLSSHLFMKK